MGRGATIAAGLIEAEFASDGVNDFTADTWFFMSVHNADVFAPLSVFKTDAASLENAGRIKTGLVRPRAEITGSTA